MRADLVVFGRRVLTPEGERDAAVVVKGGRISAVIPPAAAPRDCPRFDAGDLVVMPGLVDSHVHVNEPGRTEWEGFETATRAAAAGGITTIVDMPLNSSPVTTTLSALETKLGAARGRVSVDCAFWGGVVPGNRAELAPMAERGVRGFKAFLVHSGIEDFPQVGEADLRGAMTELARLGRPLLVHAELARAAPPPVRAHPRRYADYLASRPAAWEDEAAELLARLCRETGCAVHIVHLSSAGALAALARARAVGLPLSAETCPHYLTFTAEEVPEGRTEFKCAPPIRERANRERLWEALKDGLIGMVVSDHSPCAPELKLPGEGDFQRAWGGISSLQFGLPAVWTQASERGFGLADLSRWMCASPARLAGLEGRKGLIAPGFDADLVVWDPDAWFHLEAGQVRHRHRLTPYEGRTLRGAVRATFVRGAKVFEAGAFAAAPGGELLVSWKNSPN